MIDNNHEQSLGRLPTGLPSLDAILQGGFFKRSVYLLTGAAGTGKTILANQICFAHVSGGGRATYITLLAETHAHLFANLQSLSFFDRSVIGTHLNYYSGASALTKDGLDGLLTLTANVMRQQMPSLLVFDTLSLAQTLEHADFDFQRFVNKLSVYAEVNNATVLLLSHPGASGETDFRNTLVDGIIQLHYDIVGKRTARGLEVRKLRGSRYLEGQHNFRFDDSGMTLFPQTEIRHRVSIPPMSNHDKRLTFGIPGFDRVIHDGLLEQSTTMLLGVPGTGKTLLGVHFLLAGAENGERGLYFGFQEPPDTLVAKAKRVGLNMATPCENGLIDMEWHSPLEDILDAAAEHLLSVVRDRRPKRVFIDSLAGFQRSIDYGERFETFFLGLLSELRLLGTTTVFSVEMGNLFGPSIELPFESSALAADNIIFLRFVELKSQLYRLISMIKMRDSDYESSIREFKITARGIEVESTFDSAQAILTGVAQPTPTNSLSTQPQFQNPTQT